MFSTFMSYALLLLVLDYMPILGFRRLAWLLQQIH